MTTLAAGAACVSIAPRPDDLRAGIYLGGFGSYRQRRSRAVHDDPQCRAIAISDGETTFVIAALDLVGASGPLFATIRAEAARITGMPTSNLLISCTHSHASPDMQGLWGGTTSAYETHVARQAASAIGEACRKLAPATAAAATTTLAGVVRNRRGWPETDDTLTALRFVTRTGAAIGTLVNYACHPTASGPTNTEISRDWCGITNDTIDAAIGGVTVYVNGAIGDANPVRDGGFDAVRVTGDAVAASAITALDSAVAIDGAITLHTERLELPINFEGLSTRVQGAVAKAGPALSVLSKTGGMRAASVALHAVGRSDLAQIVAAFDGISERRMLHDGGQSSLPTLCGYLRLGSDLEGFVAPGEVLTRLGLPLRASLGARHRLFLGLTHDTLGYFLPEDEWMIGRNNNYEESVSMGKRGGTLLAEALMRIAQCADAPTAKDEELA